MMIIYLFRAEILVLLIFTGGDWINTMIIKKTKTIVKELRKQVKNSTSLITKAMTGIIGVVLGLNYYQNLLKMDSGRNAIEKQIKDRVLSLQSIE